jgi:uncharacterized protein (TIGR02996 family)
VPSPDLSAILKAVRRGDDPSAPHVLADWLEENGGPDDVGRAEHIRLELRAQDDTALSGQTWVEERLSEIRQQHGPTWLGEVFGLRGVQRWTLEEGLVWLWLRPPVLKKGRLAQLTRLAAEGWLAGVRCEGWKRKPLARLFASPHLAGIPALEVLNGPAPVSRLLDTPHLGGLERLRLVNCEIDARAVYRLANTQGMPSLAALELPFNKAGSAGLAALARSPLLPRLFRLNLEANQIGPRGIRALADAPVAEGLHLKLAFNRVRCRGAKILAASPVFKLLASLDLAWNDIGPKGGAALASAPVLPPLHIDGNDLGPAYAILQTRRR